MAELERRGVTRAAACAFLDRGPGLALEVYTAARFDCGGEYEVGLALDGRSDPVPVDVLAQVYWMAGCAAVSTTRQMAAEPQRWRRQVLRLEAYQAGVRRAVVLLRARGQLFWSGHYGAKLSAPALRFVAPP